MIRVVIADDYDAVRQGIELLLEVSKDIVLVGHAADGAEAVELARTTATDVVLMDIEMPVMNGIDATRVIYAERSARVVILTTFDHDDYVDEALQAGASGFILKTSSQHDIAAAIRAAHSGDALLSPSVAGRVVTKLRTENTPAEATPLSPRELDVLRELATGKSNAEIAEALFVSETTVKSHISSCLTKLDLRDRVQLIAYAYAKRIISPHRNQTQK